MFLSVFDIFKVGIGPSSSHTMGPMAAALRFVTDDIRQLSLMPARFSVTLHGSLAFTGKGHGTDRAIALGLLGYTPQHVDVERVDDLLDSLTGRKSLEGPAAGVRFDPASDIHFDYGVPLPGHVNGMVFHAYADDDARLLSRIYYSIGGGFIVSEDELANDRAALQTQHAVAVRFPFDSADAMLRMGKVSGLSIVAMKRANETLVMPDAALDTRLDVIWQVMDACIDRGLTRQGVLPGGLNVKRRASGIYRQLLQPDSRTNSGLSPGAMDWLNVFAMAVNEENAAGGRVVTAPTNGAAGVIPAVIRYYRDHINGATQQGIRDFLLTAAAIGGIIKHKASISGAEVGCQGEIGSASAMAAAGLAAALGATNAQIENAAEIALEHHLGMTCDPVGGLVQIPCIERNGFGALKAVNSTVLAMRGDGSHIVSLDNCIRTMRDTGRDMNSKYKETSTGGLAVNIVEC
ncbi:MAG: L-serine ammonia-lyase [Afipia sp.]|nr:L-serine ammonia-lyase [Afipia sp.]